jgi:hypothetical protein
MMESVPLAALEVVACSAANASLGDVGAEAS